VARLGTGHELAAHSAGDFDHRELPRRLVPLQSRLGRLVRRGQANPDHKAAASCHELTQCWPPLFMDAPALMRTLVSLRGVCWFSSAITFAAMLSSRR
jgi:hypothetical protein